ncbi:hypothetical protein BDV98DRAFT_557732 [Pterulicium gracile]|uniref:DUF6593 domain-containing protein n=1 Tax=Pterulicium gracile TaxID=1884261 RepID=A0A5C3R1A1_9AGAR|nr:hypothetical protein BDV98DRAFT_557732 [Pterula gracilis]
MFVAHSSSAQHSIQMQNTQKHVYPTTSELFVTRSIDDARNFDIIGEIDHRPCYVRFETNEGTSPGSSTRTLVYRNEEGIVAILDWVNRDHLGTYTLPMKTQVSMHYLASSGSAPHCRSFLFAGQIYEWRRQPDNRSYDLYNSRNGRIASFTRFNQAQTSPVGPTFGLIQTTAVDEAFLLQALLSLVINRWLDRNGPAGW